MDWKTYWAEIKRVFASLDTRKRMLILGSAVASVALILILVSFASRINYSVLFSGLDPAEAGSIVENLKAEKVSYKLENGGTTILVPGDKVYDLRLQLASQGLPQAGVIGYEIFDRNNIGSTDFVQKINYRRALEGELSRTISTINEVKAARVHLVIPEPRLFARDQKETTASVTLKLKPGHSLTYQQIQSIANLVASSVEGLQPENVTIVDTNGNILSQPKGNDPMMALSGNQVQLKKNVEDYYTKKLTSLLENVVGKGRVAVQVSAELNFDKVERTVEKYDPDNFVVISQEQNTQTAQDNNGDNGQKSEHVITNYEVNKTVERIVQEVGNVERLTVAVMVDGKYILPANAGKNAKPQYVPMDDTELEQIREVVKTAVGYSEERGDQIQVVNLPFERSHLDQEAQALENMERRIFWETMLKRVLYALMLLGIAFALWKIISSFKTVLLPNARPMFSLDTSGQPVNLELPPDIKNNVRLQQTIASLTKDKPDDAAKLLKAWLVEEGNE